MDGALVMDFTETTSINHTITDTTTTTYTMVSITVHITMSLIIGIIDMVDTSTIDTQATTATPKEIHHLEETIATIAPKGIPDELQVP
jgi:hypothetical protein